MKQTLIRYGDVIAVAAGGITIAAAGILAPAHPAVWIAWAVAAMAVAAARLYRHQLRRR
ncbi:hypothetical protein [Streptomyces sp. NBC_01506]|uniref:hypothetical protein n=1 Tax=Streptomyces sp. NBC_01506 TaxID=2903887 RepID=UPI00386B1002